jgi:hypothetical protein
MKTIFLFFIIIIAIIVIALILIYIKYLRPLRPKESGFEYVYVEQNGTVRELDEEEIKYLNEEFSPADGARPYIKTSYKDLTPDGKIYGYINRNRVPKNIIIEKKANA